MQEDVRVQGGYGGFVVLLSRTARVAQRIPLSEVASRAMVDGGDDAAQSV